MKTNDVTLLPIELIVADENQPRKLFEPSKLAQLKSSINKYGIMNPLRVEKIGAKYLLEDGERRWRVAKEIGLKEVPVIVLEPEEGTTRRIKQFHVQEQHEGWTPTEKAMVVWGIQQDLDVTSAQIAELLALTPTTANKYVAFAEIIDKKGFEKNNIGIEWAASIKWLKQTVKKIYTSIDEEFNRSVEKNIEVAVVSRIRAGELKKLSEIAKLKDSFRKDPKSIKTFLNTDATISKIFIDSKAKGAFYLRNAMNNAGFITNHISRFLENPDVKLDERNVTVFKSAKKHIDALLNLAE